jgi:hypothetical protein
LKIRSHGWGFAACTANVAACPALETNIAVERS